MLFHDYVPWQIICFTVRRYLELDLCVFLVMLRILETKIVLLCYFLIQACNFSERPLATPYINVDGFSLQAGCVFVYVRMLQH
mgnify:FL=1